MAPEGSGAEHDVQSRFFGYVRQVLKCLADDHPYQKATFAIPNGFLHTKGMRLRAWREGMEAGVWDGLVAVPQPPFAGLWLECKVGANTQSAEQRALRRAMERLGWRWEEFRTGEEGFKLWLEHLKLDVSFAVGKA